MIMRLLPLWVFFFGICLTANSQSEASSVNEGEYVSSDSVKAAELMNDLRSLMDENNLRKAWSTATQIEKLYLSLYGPESKEMAKLQHLQGIVLFYAGSVDKAKEYWESALRTRIQVLGPEHEEVAKSYNNLGGAYEFEGNLVQAAEYFKKAIQILQIQKGDKAFDMAAYYSNLAKVLHGTGSFDEAIVYFNKSLDISIAEYGEVHYETADCLRSIGDVFHSKGEYQQSKDYLNRALTIAEVALGTEDPEIANILNSLANVSVSIGEYTEALDLMEKAISKLKPVTVEDKRILARQINNIASIYQIKGDYRNAIEYFKIAISQQIEIGGENYFDLSSTYNNLAIVYGLLGDNHLSLEYFEKALAIFVSSNNAQNPNVAAILNNIGLIKIDLEDFPNALKSLENSLLVRERLLGKSHIDVARVYNGIGDYYDSIGEYDTAIKNLLEGASIIKTSHGDDHPLLSTFFSNIGVIMDRKGDYQEAAKYHRLALDISYKARPYGHPSIPNDIKKQAFNFRKRGLHFEAYQAYKLAITHLNYSGISSIESVSSLKSLISILYDFGDFLRDKSIYSGDLGDLNSSRQVFKEVVAAINIQSQKLSPAGKSNLAAQAAPVLASAIATNHLLYQKTDSLHYLHEAFEYAERSKAYLLYEALKEADALQIAGIPDSLLQQEYDLRLEIAYFDKKRQEQFSAGAAETDTASLALSSKIFTLNRQYEFLKQRFEREYPKYYEAKYELPVLGAAQVQRSLLRPGQTLIEYVAGDSSIFIFVLQPERLEVRQIKKDFPLEQWVQDMTRHGIYGYYTRPAAERTPALEIQTRSNYTTTARQLYEKLIAPIADLLTPELIIIPDGVLGYLPFEALLKGTPAKESNFTTYPFLLYDHQISYSYSATLLHEMRQKQHRQVPKAPLLAMAPFYRGDVGDLNTFLDSLNLLPDLTLRDALAPLPASGPEAAAAAKIWKGTAYYSSEATSKRFRDEASRYRILHLSTHGQADDRMGDYAYLAFSLPGSDSTFDRFYARDLYNMELNADLVVLSACETGIGKLRRGEGIVSLARAFAYAGAKSIVTTLWKVNDERTQDLMLRFYRHLRAGQAKDTALQRAKRDYLNANRKQGAAGMHPFFWAGFIGIGDMQAIP